MTSKPMFDTPFLLLIAFIVFVAADLVVFSSGANSFFWKYKTPPELELQKAIIESKKIKSESK